MKGLWWLGGLTLLIIIAAVAVVFIPVPAKAPTGSGTATSTPASLDNLITVDMPLPGAAVSTPFVISGKARGTWYFEASFPIVLVDWDGKIIAQGHAQAQGDWMTEDYVPFTASLDFTVPTSSLAVSNRGSLILKNDNPSGDPAKDKSLEIPVTFR